MLVSFFFFNEFFFIYLFWLLGFFIYFFLFCLSFLSVFSISFLEGYIFLELQSFLLMCLMNLMSYRKEKSGLTSLNMSLLMNSLLLGLFFLLGLLLFNPGFFFLVMYAKGGSFPFYNYQSSLMMHSSYYGLFGWFFFYKLSPFLVLLSPAFVFFIFPDLLFFSVLFGVFLGFGDSSLLSVLGNFSVLQFGFVTFLMTFFSPLFFFFYLFYLFHFFFLILDLSFYYFFSTFSLTFFYNFFFYFSVPPFISFFVKFMGFFCFLSFLNLGFFLFFVVFNFFFYVIVLDFFFFFKNSSFFHSWFFSFFMLLNSFFSYFLMFCF